KEEIRKKEEAGRALRSSRRKASVSFSDRAHPPPFRLFLPPTTKVCRLIKPDVYKTGTYLALFYTLSHSLLLSY
ncbi:hypothetical protein P4S84_26870, partial [Aneurinibacillus aneurinilyticus]|uniref:hypothetical protein n=1 Tax=Aneurinibacillus aneurinilyticus TaxID=1391 RepID=UPI002E1BC9F9|nr:hypothetical protein [Aneurinibacillus aneurinilyticus]